MRQTRISTYIDLLFCLVILPLIIMLVPVEKWIIHHTYFMLTLIVYLYALYFTYRKANIPSLFLRHKFGQVFFLIAALLIITWGLSQIPIPKDKFSTSSLDLGIRQHMRTQTVWFFFLIVTGFSLAIELTFELFRQILSKQEIEAEKNKAELALYKAQINPHFLFNTLNALYGLVLTKSDKTESAFIQFSNILKYGDKKAPVVITFCQNTDSHNVPQLIITLKNAVKSDLAGIESNRIGLKSAEKMMQLMHGGLHYTQMAESFSSTLTFKGLTD